MDSSDKAWGRRLVICCDGTWQSSVSSRENVPSNVTKLCRLIARIGDDKHDPNKKWHQIVYYDSGVGTGNLSMSERRRQGGTGAGLAENVIEAYNFIVMNYEPGDEIFCFGFSRGAYTARAVAGLVSDIGVIKAIDMQDFPEIYRAYQANQEGGSFRETQAWKDFVNGKLSERGRELSEQSEHAKLGIEENAARWEINPHVGLAVSEESRHVKAVGVWDTVGSLGVPDVGFWNNSNFRTKYGFHNVKLNEYIEHAFHALALDERRKAFRPTLWYIPFGLVNDKTKRTPELKQVWFPGVHINSGGGDDDCIQEMKADLEHLSTASLAWMLQCVSPYLTIDQEAFQTSLTHYKHWLNKVRYACTYHHETWADWILKKLPHIPFINPAPGPLAPPRRDPPHAHPKFEFGWGIGPIVDSYGGLYRLNGKLQRIPGHCKAEIYDRKTREYTLDDISKHGQTNEYIHPICEYRRTIRGREANSPLGDFDRVFKKEANGLGRYWWYKDGEKKGLPEWVILRHDPKEVNYERTWYHQCDKGPRIVKSLESAGCKKDWLDGLDEVVDFGIGDKADNEYP